MLKLVKFCGVLLVVVCLCEQAFAQAPLYYFRQNIPVIETGRQLALPWAGGFNSPQFSTTDLNLDGSTDLVVFDRTHNKVVTFLATENAGQWSWQHAPAYETQFPEGLYYWMLLKDADNDGQEDIFTAAPGGARVFLNKTTAAGQLNWQLASELLYYQISATDSSNILTQATDISAIEDIDGDGDLDILIADGGQIKYFQNRSRETRGRPGIHPFILATDFWGSIKECGCSNYVFGAQATCRVTAASTPEPAQHKKHFGTALLAIDLDNDQDKDLLRGDVLCSNLVKLTNSGTSTNAIMLTADLVYPQNTQAANFQIFPAAYAQDVTFDGKPDLLVAPNVFGQIGDTSVNFAESAWLYSNTSNSATPNFMFTSRSFLQQEMIERGDGAAPAHADLDADGDLDMLVGNYYSKTSIGVRSTIALYTNTGTDTAPVYTLQSSDYLQLSSLNLYNLRPGFADVNGDGRQDLIFTSTRISNWQGRILYLLNTAPVGQPFLFNGPVQTLASGYTGFVDDFPFFTDVDADGVQDLLIGAGSGALKYYRNTATNSNPVYQLVSDSLGHIGPDFFRAGLTLSVADINGDNQPDLVTADDSGVIRIYSNYRSQVNSTLTENVFFVVNSANQSVEATRLGRRLSLNIADLDADTKPEMIVGTKGGGLLMLSQNITAGNNPIATNSWATNVFPNPASELAQIKSSVPVTLTVTDVLGRVLFTRGVQLLHQLNTELLSTGLYIITLTSEAGLTKQHKLLVNH